MSPSTPFVEANTETLDTDRIVEEATPLAKLIGIVGVVAYAPLAVLTLGVPPGLTFVFTLTSQFLLAVGLCIVLLYVISRAIKLSSE